MQMTLPRILPAAMAVLCLAAPAAAQQSDAQLRDEISFARGLATRWGFVDMAERVLERVERVSGASAAVSEEAALARAEVYYAAGVANAARRDELFARAIETYQTFISRNEYSDRKEFAESEVVRISSASARSLSLKLENTTGEEALALKDRIKEVLKSAVESVEGLIGRTEKLPPAERGSSRYLELLLQRADLRLEQARLGEKDPYLKWSDDGYQALIAVAEDSSPYELRGFIGLGDVRAEAAQAPKQYEEAADFYEYVVETAIPRGVADWGKDMSTADEANRRFLFMQMAIPGLVSSLQKAGRQKDSVEWGLHFYNTWKGILTLGGTGKPQQINLTPHALYGPLAQLELARTLIDAGGFIVGEPGKMKWVATQEEAGGPRARNVRAALDLALGIAQQVNAENKGNTLQVRAQKVISEVISRPGIQVSPEVLFEAALGDYNDRDYARSLNSFRRVLAALERSDQAKRTEVGGKVMYHIGRSLQQVGRPLEAAMAFETGLLQFAGDPEFDESNSKQFHETAKVLRRQLKDDPVVEALFRSSEEVARRFQKNVDGAIQMREAEELYDKKKYADAKARYKAIPLTTAGYEEAMVMVGVCDYHLKDYPAAQKVFQDYIEGYTKDPTNALTKQADLASRQKATAAATYYWGRCAFDQQDYRRAVQLLDGYHLRFPAQDSIAPDALRHLLESHAKLDDNKAALETFELLVQTFPDSPATASAAFTTYRQLKERFERESDAQKKLVLLRQMAENLQVANRNARTPSLSNLRNEASHWVDLATAAGNSAETKPQAAELWATAEAVLKRIRSSFDAKQTDVVIPSLGRALLAQYKVQEAAEVLKPMAEARAGREVTFDYTRALAGWPEITTSASGQTQVVQVPGVGTVEAFEEASKLLVQLQASAKNSDAWGPDDYRYRAAQMYVLHQWGQLDGKKLTEAKDLMKLLVSNLGERFDDADKKPEGETLQCFLWLKEKLK